MNRERNRGGARGASSFHMQNSEEVFAQIDVKKGERFLDLGCGMGDYSFEAAERVGDTGNVFAVDRWEGLIGFVNKECREKQVQHIEAISLDITQKLPFPNQSMDVCFLATVLHTIRPNQMKVELTKELKRVTKNTGQVAILNVKKEDLPFGPPSEVKFSPRETEILFKNCGFKKIGYHEFQYTYLIRFSPEN